MQIHFVLDPIHAQKLNVLSRQTNTAATEVLLQALDFYYRETQNHRRSAAEILRDTGFVGSLDAEADYSENYKQTLTEALETKHGYRG